MTDEPIVQQRLDRMGLVEPMTGRVLRIVSIASLLSIVASLCVFDVMSLDFGWHLKAGEIIWNTKSIPREDIFSYIAEGRPWLDSHWLFQVILHAVYALAGSPGAILLRCVVGVSTFALILATARCREYTPVALLVCLLALFSSHQRMMLRPELVSLLFLATLFFCFDRLSKRPKLSLSVVFVCQLLWANMHGLHALGVAFAGLYFAGDLIQWRVGQLRPQVSSTEVTLRDVKLSAQLLGVVVVASLLNANGLDGILYPYVIFSELRGDVHFFPVLAELSPPFSTRVSNFGSFHPAWFYKALLAVSLLSWIGPWRRARFAHVLLYLTFLYLSLLAVRNIALFAVVATPITILNMNATLDSWDRSRIREWMRGRGAVWVTASVGLLLAGAIWTAQANDWLYPRLQSSKNFGLGVSVGFSDDLLSALRDIDGRVFNAPSLGGYLVWELYPEKQIAVDGRWEVYGNALPQVMRAFRKPAVFSRLAKRHEIDAVLLDRWSNHSMAMHLWLKKSDRWKLVRQGRNAVLFERKSE